MRKSNLMVLASFLILITGACSMSKRSLSSLQFPEAKEEQAFALMEKSVELFKTPGAVCLLGNSNEIQTVRAFGYTTFSEPREKVSGDTIYDLASVTKIVATNTAIMQLVEQGRLELEKPVSFYLPEFRGGERGQITLWHLLTHSSGLPADVQLHKTCRTKEEFYRELCKLKLEYAPGKDRVYSNMGYIVLGFLVEKVSGQTFVEYCQEHIFVPLEMKDTFFIESSELKGRCAPTIYDEKTGVLRQGVTYDNNARALGTIAPHGGLFSSASDLAHFCQMILKRGMYKGRRVLAEESIEQFQTLQLKPPLPDFQGLGWLRKTDQLNGKWGGLGPGSIGHPGTTGTALWIHPQKDFFAILLSNATQPEMDWGENANYYRRRFYVLLSEQLFPPQPALLPIDEDWVEQTLKGMTLEEKASQVLFPFIYKRDAAKLVKELQPGGIIISLGEKMELARQLNELQSLAKNPLVVTADFERGVGTYIDGATDLPIAMSLGASFNPFDAYWSGRLTGLEGRLLGAHVNFAPVADVNYNPKNPIINIRSFGEDPELVARMAGAWVQGQKVYGLQGTAKHFPGHGNTSIDSHTSLGKVPGTREDLKARELYPFKYAIEQGVEGIMSAHLWVPAFEEQPIPATASHGIMTGLLKQELGFKGIIYTDALDMGGISKELSFEESIVRSLQAGCHVLLMPGKPEQAHAAIVNGVKNGDLPLGVLDEAVRKVLRLKTQMGLHKNRKIDLEKVEQVIGCEEHREIAHELARNTIAAVSDRKQLLPLKAGQKLCVLEMTNQKGQRMIWRDVYRFGEEVKRFAPEASSLFLGDEVTTQSEPAALALAREADVIILAIYARVVIHRGNVSLNPEQYEFIKELVQLKKPVLVVGFGNPYIINELPKVSTYVCAYSNPEVVQEAAAEGLFGKFVPGGYLPVSINRRYGLGYRLDLRGSYLDNHKPRSK